MKTFVRIKFGKSIQYIITLGVILGWVILAAAQQTISSSIVKKPDFQNPAMDDYMQRILVQMDAFNADSAIYYINSAFKLLDENSGFEEEYYLLSYRAEVLYYEGLFNEAIHDLDKCLKIANQFNDSLLISNVYNLKGLLHENIQDSKEALGFLELALDYYPKYAAARYPVTELHHIYGNMGSYLTKVGDLDSAGICLIQSLNLANNVGALRAISVANASLGQLALKQNLADSALHCFQKSAEIAAQANDRDISLDAFIGSAQAAVATGDFKLANFYLDLGQSHSTEYANNIGLATRRNFSRQASDLYLKMGELEMSLVKLNEWHKMDSLISAGNVKSALRTQAALFKSDTELQLERITLEKTAEDLNQAKFNQRVLIGGGSVILALLISIYLFYTNRQKQKMLLKELEVLKLQQEQTIAELRIREQVGRDMHDDLGAGLSALKLRSEMSLRIEKDPDRRRQMTDIATTARELIDSMRQIIWSMNADQSSLEDLAVYASNYARTYLSDNNIEVKVSSDLKWPSINLSSEERRNIFLVVKESLHNVVKHARATEVILNLKFNKAFVLEITDNGSGLNDDAVSGNGMKNMRKRISDLKGEIQWKTNAGTHVQIRIPFNTNESSIAN